MIRRLKFCGIKCQKAGFLMNRLDLSDLSDKPFPIVISRSVLLRPAARQVGLFLDVEGVIPTPV